jgi:dolichyl-phosphate beta-glucosyltransferase
MDKKWLIIPCYNEESRFRKEKFIFFFENDTVIDKVLFVNDGSTDSTAKIINSFKKKYLSKVDVLNLELNKGKAEAVRCGIELAIERDAGFVGFADADLATELEEVALLFQKIESLKHINILMGSRFKRLGSHIKRTDRRHILGRIFSTFASLILKMPVYDTQCGAKVFRSEKTKFIFESPFLTSWLFDIELIARYRNKIGLGRAIKSIFEYPLQKWTEVPGSKLKLRHYIMVPIQLFIVWRNYNLLRRD